MSDVLDTIAATVAARRDANPQTSYVASLNEKGIDKILQKVGEEAVEVILAAKNADSSVSDSAEVINEVADLVFHILVMLDRLGISHNDVMAALAARQGISGLEEKASRNAD
ncbi:MAG: phosphoribosyl-ATP diphosphatase [Gammaproteobacteria bacterium]|nr:phosphoribosyl-ATP diphosphatase [Luminiphilus sp.]NCG05460.1 phosphoribosyl-ATP diphosphatase [Gammaproteobacteria bacterium]